MAQAVLSTMNPLPSLIRAAAWDAGNASARANGRAAWNRAGFYVAGETQESLIKTLYGDGPEGFCRFGYAEALEKAGVLSLATRDFWEVFDAAWTDYLASFEQAA